MRGFKIPELGDATPRRGNFFTVAVAGTFLRILGWGFEGKIPNVAKAVLIVAPHTSNWDFFIGIAAEFALGLRVVFLGKHTVFVWPLGVLMRWLGGIPIDRRAAKGVVDETVALFAATDQLIIGLSPEGTRSMVERWKTGFYYVAHKADVPIIPVALDYHRRLVRIGESFVTTGDLENDLRDLEEFYFGIEGRREN